jgi:hypothetical protein
MYPLRLWRINVMQKDVINGEAHLRLDAVRLSLIYSVPLPLSDHQYPGIDRATSGRW